jgi:hypothetical protein
VTSPTEADIRAYEVKVASRQQRRANSKHPLLKISGMLIVGFIVDVIAASIEWGNSPDSAFSLSNSGDGSPSMPGSWLLHPAPLLDGLAAVACLFFLVVFIQMLKDGQGHQVRTIARARRAALYPGHPWVQYRIEHPYMSHVLVIAGMLTVLNVLNGRKR